MTFEQIENEFITHGLSRHPLVKEGYSSVGCTTCTICSKRITILSTSNRRAGRLELDEHRECGIHVSR